MSEDIKAARGILAYAKERYNRARQQAHDDYVRRYRNRLRLCDLLILLAVIANLAALFTTNMLVVKQAEQVSFHEANPITAERLGVEPSPSPEKNKVYAGIVINLLVYALLVGWYLYLRWMVHDNKGMIYLGTFTVIIAWFLIYDGVNNLGYYAGVFL